MPRPNDCNHEDWPCCGCGDEPSQEQQEEMFQAQVADQDRELSSVDDLDDEGTDEPWDGFHSDGDADRDALASAGMGMDEDYGGCGDTPMGDFYGGE